MQNDMTKEKLERAADDFHGILFGSEDVPNDSRVWLSRHGSLMMQLITNAIAASEVDVEALKKFPSDDPKDWELNECAYRNGWNECLSEISSLGVLRTADTGGWHPISSRPDNGKFLVGIFYDGEWCVEMAVAVNGKLIQGFKGAIMWSPLPAAPTHPEVSHDGL